MSHQTYVAAEDVAPRVRYRTFTVIGIYLDGEPIVTGVIEGRHNVQGGSLDGSAANSWESYIADSLFADYVEAVSADEAQTIALGSREPVRP